MTATTTTFAGATAAATRAPEAGMTRGGVRAWLRLEGLAAFGAGLALFGASGGNWLFLVPLLLLPDLSVAGYLAGPRIGAFAYNAVHNWAPGMAALGLGAWLGSPTLLLVAAVLIAHVGMDRAAGFGLKLPGSFQETHLGRMGRSGR
jgi:hypothetical protein